LTVGGVESTFIVLETVEEFPALSTVRKFTVYVPFVSEALACQAPPLTDTCALAKPDRVSVPLLDTATGDVLCQPFEPLAAGYTAVRPGAVTSLFQVVEPVADERPLIAAATL
jgi:hypothetical protein